MEDYSNFKGTGAVAPPAERIWGLQKKRKAGERNPQNGRRREREKEAGENPNRLPEPLETLAGNEPVSLAVEETPGYGGRRGIKKTLGQVDLVI
jgi:hypothetical protein